MQVSLMMKNSFFKKTVKQFQSGYIYIYICFNQCIRNVSNLISDLYWNDILIFYLRWFNTMLALEYERPRSSHQKKFWRTIFSMYYSRIIIQKYTQFWGTGGSSIFCYQKSNWNWIENIKYFKSRLRSNLFLISYAI